MKKEKKKEYQALLDIKDLQGNFWLSGRKRKLTKKEAEPYLIRVQIALSDKELLENILHPTLKINDVDILHRHTSKRIIFEGWSGDKQLPKTVSFNSQWLLHNFTTNKDFYDNYYLMFEELTEV